MERGMRNIDRHTEWVAAMIGGLLSGAGLATSWKFAPTKDFWDVLTALGTVGAVFVALGIALFGSVQRRRAATEMANLAAARVIAAVEQSIKFASYASNWAENSNQSNNRVESDYAALKRCLNSAQIQVENGDLLALVQLPKRCAHRLARASAILTALQREVVAFQSYFDRELPDFTLLHERRAEVCGAWRQQIASAIELLVIVKSVCAKAADLGAPVPDGAEILRITI